MRMMDIQRQFEQYVVANYRRLPVCIARGQGSKVWDVDGKEYLDLFPGWGVAGLGHCHPVLVEAISRQAAKLIHVANNYYNEEQGVFAEILSSRAEGMKVFFCNSGAEANEAAIKLARLASQPRHKIVTMLHSFHGRTFAAISATGQPEYQAGFAPIVPGFSYAVLNDITSVMGLVDDQTCAIMVEPVQGEAGVIPAQVEFLQALRRLCDERNMLLIFDEVQTTPARLGTWFGYQKFGVKPDIITTAKAVAGGMPMAVLLANPEVAQHLKPGTHASTFGGHSLGCAAGIAAWRHMEKENIPGRIVADGERVDALLGQLKSRVPEAVKDVRRAGFMIGIELQFPAGDVVADCRNHGVLINCTHDTVIRLLPALNIEMLELEQGLGVLADCLERGWKKTAASVRLKARNQP